MVLSWKILGTGSPVVLLQAAGATLGPFGELPERLAKTHRVLIPFMPGYGSSARQQPIDFAATDRMLLADLRELDASRPALIGYSMGGYRALRLLLLAGGEASRVLLLGGFADLSQAERTGLGGAGRALRDDPSVAAAIAASFFAPQYRERHPEAVESLASWITESRAVAADELEAAATLDGILPRVAELKAPLHLRVGAVDLSVDPGHSRELHERVAGSTLDVVPGAAHGLFIEDADATTAWVLRSLSADPL